MDNSLQRRADRLDRRMKRVKDALDSKYSGFTARELNKIQKSLERILAKSRSSKKPIGNIGEVESDLRRVKQLKSKADALAPKYRSLIGKTPQELNRVVTRLQNMISQSIREDQPEAVRKYEEELRVVKKIKQKAEQKGLKSKADALSRLQKELLAKEMEEASSSSELKVIMERITKRSGLSERELLKVAEEWNRRPRR